MDTEQVPNSASTGSMFDAASPKLTFWFGFFVGAGLITLVGFIFMIVMMFTGASFVSAKTTAKTATTNTNTAAVVNTNTATAPTVVDASKLTVTSDDYVRGNPNAKVTIVEFSDIECPYCKRFHPEVKSVLDANSNDVRWVFKHFPLSFHPEAKPAAVAAECAGKLGGNDGFWGFVDAMYDNQSDLGADLYKKVAADLKLDATAFATCMTSTEFDAKISAEQALGQSVGVGGTPTSFVVVGSTATALNGAVPQADITAAVKAALAKI